VKRSELLFSTLLVPIDALAIFSAFILSYYARAETGTSSLRNVLPMDRYLKISLGITAVWLLIFALTGLYQLRSTRRGLSEFSRIAAAIVVGIMAVIAVIFFGRIDFSSRLVMIYAFVSSLVLVTLFRIIVRAVQQSLFKYGIGVRRALMVGTAGPAQTLSQELTHHNRGYVIVGYVETGHQPRAPKRGKVLGGLADVPRLLGRLAPDELLLAEPRLNDEKKLELINAAEDYHVDLRFTSDLTELATSRVESVAVGGIPLMTVQHTPLEGWGRILKRLFDLAASLLALPFILLLYPFIAGAIKLESAGPVIFRQTRVGKAGRQFTSFKFRTMVPDAEAQLAKLQAKNEASGPVFKMKNDPRVTKVGRFLRRTSLDELPQFFNVLKGDMSLVGPRPPIPAEVAKYDRQQRRRLTIKPGITGPWQVSGRSDISFDEWVRLDVYYIQNWSLLLDLTILLKTVAVVLSRRGAY
jgi:exopolysaccharide biosynthesis polyprenyl glycosylphosphotransferase